MSKDNVEKLLPIVGDAFISFCVAHKVYYHIQCSLTEKSEAVYGAAIDAATKKAYIPLLDGVVILDESKYKIIKEELPKTFKEQVEGLIGEVFSLEK